MFSFRQKSAVSVPNSQNMYLILIYTFSSIITTANTEESIQIETHFFFMFSLLRFFLIIKFITRNYNLTFSIINALWNYWHKFVD